jgi:AcrR family transcriptional regulator
LANVATSTTPSGKTGTKGVPRPVREAQILEVASAMFAEQGYHATSMEEVARRAGVTKPIVYSYFGSKEGLYASSVRQAGTNLLERMRSAAPPGAAADEILETALLEFFRFVDEHRHDWTVLYTEASASGGPLAEELAELRGLIAEAVGRLLEACGFQGEPGRPAPGEAEGMAHAFVGAGESLANWWLAHPEADPETVAGWLMGFARSGLGLRAGR